MGVAGRSGNPATNGISRISVSGPSLTERFKQAPHTPRRRKRGLSAILYRSGGALAGNGFAQTFEQAFQFAHPASHVFAEL